MSRKVQRVHYHLDPKGIGQLPIEELKVILRGADDLIGQGGRSLLVKILRGSRAQEVLNLHLDQIPVHGCYRGVAEEDVLAKIDRTIFDGYLQIVYDYRLPVLTYTDAGWAIEKETCAIELLQGFDKLLTAAQPPHEMSYLKDRGGTSFGVCSTRSKPASIRSTCPPSLSVLDRRLIETACLRVLKVTEGETPTFAQPGLPATVWSARTMGFSYTATATPLKSNADKTR